MFRSSSWERFPTNDNKQSEDLAVELSFGLCWRLLDDRNKKLRAFVHDLTLESIVSPLPKLAQDLLSTLVNKLPNLDNL